MRRYSHLGVKCHPGVYWGVKCHSGIIVESKATEASKCHRQGSWGVKDRGVGDQVRGSGVKILMLGFTSSNGTGVKGPESGWNYQFWFTVWQRGCGFFIPWEYEKSARNYAKLPIFKCVLLVLPVANLPWNCSKVHELHMYSKKINIMQSQVSVDKILASMWKKSF